MRLSITDPARQRVLELRAAEPEPEGLGLWLEVIGASPSGYAYDMGFLRLDEVEPGDVVVEHDGLRIVVPESSRESLDGSTIDLDGRLGGGLLVDNPNPPSPLVPGLDAAQLSGSVEQRVSQVIEGYINPAISAHGGSCRLVAVDGDQARVVLGGGCHGCGMAAVTLRQGIEAAILQAVPEITAVVDVTDHAAGENPYFAPAAGP